VAAPAPPPLIAHRGWQRRFPENTLAAVRGALEAGAGWIEVDVQLSRDGVPHLFHDPELKRLTGARGRITDRASEPGRLGEGFADEPVARLEALVDLLAAFPRAEAFVELKSESVEAFGVEAVLDAVLPVLGPLELRARLISFHLGVLRAARKRCDLELGPVLERWKDRSSDDVLDLEPEVVFCNVRRLPRGGWIAPPVGRLAVYEIDAVDQARDLLGRGATWIETFAVGEMLEAWAHAAEGGA
jgi:glycerophosphoryl diester phosphodiesterase